MDLNHLHIHVRELASSKRFYESYFGFRERIRHGEILFLRNEEGFDLALAPAAKVEPLPSWFHFGFRLPTAEAVRTVRRKMIADGIRLAGDFVDEPDLVSFRGIDPDGYAIEIYWE